MFNKLYKNIHQETFDLTNEILFSITLDNCVIDHLRLPIPCKQITTFTSTIRKITVTQNIECMYCEGSGIEQIICDGPCPNVKTLFLAHNKLIKFTLQLVQKPFEVDLTNNDIVEIQYKIPFHFNFKDDGNPIRKMRSDYINYENY